MARSMFARGADFIAAMVFMFASTNLVFELGIVLLVLIGWQFLVAEFVGGVIMIVLLVTLGALWLRGRALDDARNRVNGSSTNVHHQSEHVDSKRLPLSKRLRSRASWTDAATYTIGDVTMLRKEMVIGFGVAGFLTTIVPIHLWNDLFFHGHGAWTTVENAIVGPLVAIISFVCSIGNVPLAAALWQGGISFGGVISFVFADLITLPLLLVYRKQYGRRMTLRLLGLFWVVMSAAGLATQGIFRIVGWIPTIHPKLVASQMVRWNDTTVLDIVALIVLAVLYWLYRNRHRLGNAAGYTQDPVCGMQVETNHAPAAIHRDGRYLYFCSQHCKDRFEKSSLPSLDSAGPIGEIGNIAIGEPIGR
jgi:YHS domain-containing protein/uncharacterized membrane protein YraQ (UPF0718 family)